MPSNFTQASFEASIESSFDTWEGVDDGLPEAPVVPVVNFGGQTTVTDPFALDGVNVIALAARAPGRHSGRDTVLGSECTDHHDDRRRRKDRDAVSTAVRRFRSLDLPV